jgi:hypothetical protein
MIELLRLILLPLRIVSSALYIAGKVGLLGLGVVVFVVAALGAFILVGFSVPLPQ